MQSVTWEMQSFAVNNTRCFFLGTDACACNSSLTKGPRLLKRHWGHHQLLYLRFWNKNISEIESYKVNRSSYTILDSSKTIVLLSFLTSSQVDFLHVAINIFFLSLCKFRVTNAHRNKRTLIKQDYTCFSLRKIIYFFYQPVKYKTSVLWSNW